MMRKFHLPEAEADQVLYGVVTAKKMCSLCSLAEARSALSSPQLTTHPKALMLPRICRSCLALVNAEELQPYFTSSGR